MARIKLRILLIALFVAALSGAPKNNPVDLTINDLNGKRVHLKDYRGQIVVLNFWATWCGPCTHEMPMLVDAEKEYKARGVLFIAASLDESKSKSQIPAFVSKYQIGFPVWTGATGDDLAKLGMGPAVPATAFIDQEGHIVARVWGEIRKEEAKERIEWLLGDRTGAAPEALVKHLGN